MQSVRQIARFVRNAIDILQRRPLGEIANYARKRIAWEIRDRERTRRRVHEHRGIEAPDTGLVLFYSPEAGIDRHFAAQCVLARTLSELGHRVAFAFCFDGFRRCPVMDMRSLPYDPAPEVRTETCLRCAGNAFEMLDSYGLSWIDLSAYRPPGMQEEIQRTLSGAPHDLREFRYESYAIGAMTVMDLTTARKVHDLDEPGPELRACWLQYIESALQSYLVTAEVCRRLNVTHLVHFNDYANNEAARLAARTRGIPSFTVFNAGHRNIDRRRFVISADVGSMICYKQREGWPGWRELALSPAQVQDVADDLLIRLGGTGTHVYSPAKTFQEGDPRERFGLARDKKLLVAYTSSLDEMMANRANRAAMGFDHPAPPQPFADQHEWIAALIELVERRDDLQLAVRVHPREGPNKRDNVSSQHLERLRERFDRPFRNCRIFWPQDPVSSYDLGEIADVALVAWASLGHELSRLGVPVLSCTSGLAVVSMPRDDFVDWGATPDLYFEKLHEMLDRPANLETIARAFRWYNLLQLGITVDLGDVVSEPDPYALPPYRLPAEARTVEDIILRGQDVIEINRARMAAAQHERAKADEAMALQRQLRRFIRFLFTGSRAHEDYRLVRGEVADSHAWRIHVEGSLVRLAGGRTSLARYSPLCRRLAPLCSEPVAP